MSESTKPKDWDGTEVELTVTAKIKYKVQAKDYGDAETLEQAVAIDMVNLHEDPIGILAMEMQLNPNGVVVHTSWDKV